MGETCQDTETNRSSHAHSLPGDSIGRDLSGHGTKPTRQSNAHSLPGDGVGRDLSGLGKKLTERRALTLWRQNHERPVRTRKQTDRAMRTHQLETASGETCQGTETNRSSDAHSLSRDGIGMDLSGHGKKTTERCSLTSWRRHRDGLVRTQKQPDRARRTHQLETESGDLSGHGNKLIERCILTIWRRHWGRLVRTRKQPD